MAPVSIEYLPTEGTRKAQQILTTEARQLDDSNSYYKRGVGAQVTYSYSLARRDGGYHRKLSLVGGE